MQLTVREVAKYINVSEESIYRWLSKREIPFCRVNGQYRFNQAEILEWANARKLRVSTAIFRKESGNQPLPRVEEALRTGGIFYQLPGADKPAALRAMVDRLRLPEKVDKETLYQILLARETLGSTAIGNGIALPHVRSPIVLFVPTPFLSLFFLETPIEFGAPDHKPVHALFSLVAPTIHAHMHMLSRLATLVRDAGFGDAIARKGTPDEILAEARRVEAALAASATEKK
jgi:PTS system nitrogen regulatory IIA component